MKAAPGCDGGCELDVGTPPRHVRRNCDTARLASLRDNDKFELGFVVNRCDDRLHGEGCSSGFEGVQPIFGIWRRCRIEQHRDTLD